MNKHKILSLALVSAIALTAFVGCSDDKKGSTTSNGTVVVADSSSSKKEVVKNDTFAENIVSVNIAEDASMNNTTFRLNRIMDSGETDENGNPYIYLDVNISNSTPTEYDLSVLNNFYILLPDSNEVHFNVKTQIYATNNIDGYCSSPFTIPANGEFSGIIGGFILPKDTDDFNVCFFPTQDDTRNKSNVIKVNANANNIEK